MEDKPVAEAPIAQETCPCGEECECGKHDETPKGQPENINSKAAEGDAPSGGLPVEGKKEKKPKSLSFLKGKASKVIRDPKWQRVLGNRDKEVGPNEKCPCKSGKKYKKCCMYKNA